MALNCFKKLQMMYASLWSFSYFTFTLNQLLTPDTREYKNVCLYKDMGFTQIIYIIIALQIEQSYLMSAMKPCIYSELLERVLCTSLVGWPWFCHGAFTEKRQKKTLKVNHGWPWLVSQPWLPNRIGNHGWPWFGKAVLNHSQPWLAKFF